MLGNMEKAVTINTSDIPDIFAGYDHKTLLAFKAYHKERPDIYKAFIAKTMEMKQTGRRHYSHWTIMNVIRWHYDLEHPELTFKVNNNFFACYVRLAIYHHPELADFFQLRKVSGVRDPNFEKRHLNPYEQNDGPNIIY